MLPRPLHVRRRLPRLATFPLLIVAIIEAVSGVNKCRPSDPTQPLCPGPKGSWSACPDCRSSDGWCACPDLPKDPECSLHGYCRTNTSCPPCVCDTGWMADACSEPFEENSTNKVVKYVLVVGVLLVGLCIGCSCYIKKCRPDILDRLVQRGNDGSVPYVRHTNNDAWRKDYERQERVKQNKKDSDRRAERARHGLPG